MTISVFGGGGSSSLTSLTNSLTVDVALNNTANFFDGPSVAQGTSGTWLCTGTVTVTETVVGICQFEAKLWDGTTVIASTGYDQTAVSNIGVLALSGVITNPAGNIRISVKDQNGTNGKIMAAGAGSGNTSSVVTVVRIA